MKTRSWTTIGYACLLAVALTVVPTAWLLFGATPERRLQIKTMLGLPLTPIERLRLQVASYLPKGSPALFRNEKLTPAGDLCGQVSVQDSVGKQGKHERFIVSPGKFIAIGDRELIALEDPSWKLLASTEKLAKESVLGDAKDFNRQALAKRWLVHCGEAIPIEEIAEHLRGAIKETLKDPESAMFRNENINGSRYCGELNAKNSMGGYIGFRKFYFVRGLVWQVEGTEMKPLAIDGPMAKIVALAAMQEEDVQSNQKQLLFDARWKEYCSK